MLEILYVSLLMVLIGFFVLRLAGRKSLSRMTISQAVIMVSIGSILIEPIKARAQGDPLKTTFAMVIFLVTLYILEWLTLKFKPLDNLIQGEQIEVIRSGAIHFENLKRLRMTERQLKMLLREKGVYSLEQVKRATVEANGEIGIETK